MPKIRHRPDFPHRTYLQRPYFKNRKGGGRISLHCIQSEGNGRPFRNPNGSKGDRGDCPSEYIHSLRHWFRYLYTRTVQENGRTGRQCKAFAVFTHSKKGRFHSLQNRSFFLNIFPIKNEELQELRLNTGK